MIIYDSHTHLPFNNTDTPVHLVSAQNDDWDSVIEHAKSRHIFGSIGIHPWESGFATDDTLLRLKTLLQRHDSIHLGECGLDYSHSIQKNRQLYFFENQLALANQLNRIVTIHSVRAWGDTLDFLKKYDISNRRGVVHAFRGSVDTIRELCALNYHISLGERELFQCGEKQRAAIVSIPEKRLLIESDGSGNLMRCAEALSTIRGCSVDSLIATVNANFVELFS